MKNVLLCLLLPTFLFGCSYAKQNIVQNRDRQYLAARSIPPVRIPPGFSSSAFHNEYPVSDRNYGVCTTEVSLEPPGLHAC